jgi:hypothetical protein
MSVTVEQTLEMPYAFLFAQKAQNALKAKQHKRRHFNKIVEEKNGIYKPRKG